MKPTVFEIHATKKDTGEQMTLYKLVLGNITVGKLIDNYRRKGFDVHYMRLVEEIDLAPDELLFYLNENSRID